MTPYMIDLGGYRKWIDLGSIQMIHQPFIPMERLPDNPAAWSMFPLAAFSVQFAFRDKPIEFQIGSYNEGMTGSEMLAKIELLRDEFNKLLLAWSAHGSQNLR